MADDNVIIFVTLKPKAGKEAGLEALLKGMCAPSRAEKGCVAYEMFRAKDGGNIHLYEVWKTQADLDAHRLEAHFQDFRAKLGDVADGPPSPVFLRRVDSRI